MAQSLRKILENRNGTAEVNGYSWSRLVPTKVNIHCWRSNIDRIATRDQLAKRHVPLNSDLCVLCEECLENSLHLFLHCGLADAVWCVIGQWCKISPLYAFDMKDFFSMYKNLVSDKKKKVVIKAIIRVGCWCIWRERNEAIFRNRRPSMARIIKDIKSLSYLWCINRSKNLSMEWLDWCSFTF